MCSDKSREIRDLDTIRVDDPAFFVAFEPRADRPVQWSAPSGYTVSCRVVGSTGRFEGSAIQCTYRRTTP